MPHILRIFSATGTCTRHWATVLRRRSGQPAVHLTAARDAASSRCEVFGRAAAEPAVHRTRAATWVTMEAHRRAARAGDLHVRPLWGPL